MSDKKQNSVDWLINCITEDQMVKSKSLYEWLEIFEQAKAMHKEEIKDACDYGIKLYINDPITSEDYHNETFGGNNE